MTSTTNTSNEFVTALSPTDYALLHGSPLEEDSVLTASLGAIEAQMILGHRSKIHHRQVRQYRAVETAERHVDILDGTTWVNRQGRLPVEEMTPRHAGNALAFLERSWEGPALWEGMSPRRALDLVGREGVLPADVALARALLRRSQDRSTWRDRKRDRASMAAHAETVAKRDADDADEVQW